MTDEPRPTATVGQRLNLHEILINTTAFYDPVSISYNTVLIAPSVMLWLTLTFDLKAYRSQHTKSAQPPIPSPATYNTSLANVNKPPLHSIVRILFLSASGNSMYPSLSYHLSSQSMPANRCQSFPPHQWFLSSRHRVKKENKLTNHTITTHRTFLPPLHCLIPHTYLPSSP